ncbi:MAG: hypothetical protein KJ960_08755 [Gammaproteobacteria bacterium]|nr:hypothetical protein [Gammaproteobacteria bacterium]
MYMLVAVAAMTVAAVLLLNHPLGVGPSIGFCFVLLTVYYKPSLFLFLIPAILPVIGFAPWSGWITFEEFDLVVLASAVGGYSKFAFHGNTVSSYRISKFLFVLLTAMSISILISMARGFSDAGQFVFGWFQGYDGPMNSVRIGKSFFLALLLLPLLVLIKNKPEKDADCKLGLGMAIGLGVASLAALWERLAFTDFLNFSSDYRTTALFWEMHVGGAALDGWILLTFPFSIWALRKDRAPFLLVLSLILLLLAAYAALTTFSRGVYLALLFSLPLLAWQTRQNKSEGNYRGGAGWGLSKWVSALVLVGVMSHQVFATGGYRALLALIGLVAISLFMPSLLRNLSVKKLFLSGLVGFVVGVVLILLANNLPKGPYVLYLALFLSTVYLIYSSQNYKIESAIKFSMAGFVCIMLSAANIANHWGGIGALLVMGLAVFILLLMVTFGATSKHELWPNNIHWRGNFLAMMILVGAIVSVFTGGAYMGGRFATSSQDFEGRVTHWRNSLSMLQSPMDIFFGKGLGRYPGNYYFAAPNSEFPGTYRIIEENGNSAISLVGSRHPLSYGNILRISQRLSFGVEGPFIVRFKARSNILAKIHLEVCEKHLIYSAVCSIGVAVIKPTNNSWQFQEIQLSRSDMLGGPWYAPRFTTFSFGIANGGGAAELDEIALVSYEGVNLLINGDFSDEMKYWFFSSERDHLPWHAKNIWVNILFDQGLFGFAVFLVLTISALSGLIIGRARQNELAPYITSGIIGFLVVGLFDSLTDVPRLSFIYYFLVTYALSTAVVVKGVDTRP